MTSTLASPAAAIARLARPEVPTLPPYPAGLSSELVRARYGVERVARLASNESPWGTSPAVARALTDLASSVARYPDAQCTALRQAIGERLDVAPARLLAGNGSEDLLQMLCQAFLSPGDSVLVQRPAFGLHEIYPRMMGARLVWTELDATLGFDVDAWCAALAQGPKLAMVANPSNPVGCGFDRGGFERLLAAAGERTLLVIDEAYWEYAQHAPDYPDTLAALQAHCGPWILLRTFSKAWGLAGLRVGYGVASDAALVQMLDRVRTPFNVSLAAQTAALAAWSDPAFTAAAVARTLALRESLRAAFVARGLRVAPSVANFLFVDLHRPSVPVHEALLARGVITKAWREPGYERFLRVSVGTEEDHAQLLAALDGLAPASEGGA